MKRYLVIAFAIFCVSFIFLNTASAGFKECYTKLLNTSTFTSTGVEGTYNKIVFYNPSATFAINIATAATSVAANRFGIKAGEPDFVVNTSTHIYLIALDANNATIQYMIER